ncbi:MAG TPA: outer membrane protein assembly factor BamA [Burkholderiales bacterium]|jgi:outer membrane protein insertion porin family|nr:outer membrane protein assembly factor BamA [Burkholderiales bacterium]
MHFLHVILFVFGALVAFSAQAFDPFVVKDIRIEGIQRTEAGTIFSYLPVKVGETMTEDKAAQAIRSLYATGFFKDVSLEVDNSVLIVTVQERPSVAQIDISGAKEFSKEDLLKGLRSIGLAEGRIFDKGVLDKSEQELKRQYISRGKYSAQITTTATPLERNRVALRFDIVEGEVAKIRQIGIIGNKVFKESDLRGQLKLRTPGLMTWYTKDDQYSKQKLSADLESLRSYYLDRGYLEFNIESTQVSITPDKKDVYIIIGISEGPQYTVSDIKLAGEMLIPQDDALKLVKLKAGDIFSRAKLTESTKAIGDRLGNDGYAFANVNAVPDLDKDKRKVAFTFFVDPGRRVYIRRINVVGNTRTRDEVIRREMRQLEGGWYAADAITKSKQRVDRLGYFTEVNVETPSVPGTTDQVDLNLSVAEKPTGNILLGAGYGSSEGVILSGGVSQQNVFGSGNFLGVQLNTSKVNTVYSLSFTQPYWTVDGVSRGFDIYKRNVDPTAINAGAYRTSTIGAQVRLGIPFTDIDTVSLGFGYESTSITAFRNCDPAVCIDSPLRILNYVDTFGTDNTAILGSVGWARDTRDSAIYPTRGGTQRASVEAGLPGGTLQYYKFSYQNQRYFPLSQNFTLYLNGDVGYGNGLLGKPLPFFRNYYAGGVTSVRGFYTSTIGPKDANDAPIGGSKKLVGNVELLFPFPGMSNDKSVRLSAFVDAGLIGESYAFTDTRVGAGLAVLWVSPFGPIKISVAQPFRAKDNDQKQRFQFTFGQQF